MVNYYEDGDMEFRFYRPNAQQVSLVGDFTDWYRSAIAMHKTNDGWWTRRLQLDPGVYEFQYLVDGTRYIDFAAFGVERGPLGGWNSVVVVAEPTITKTPWWRKTKHQTTVVTGQ